MPADFEQDRRRFPRSVRLIATGNGREPDQELDGLVGRLVGQFHSQTLRGFRGLAVGVEEDDGMSWAAASAGRAAADADPHPRVVHLRGELRDGAFPEIELLVSRKRIARLAQRRDLLDSARVRRPWFLPIVAGLAVAAGIGGVLLQNVGASLIGPLGVVVLGIVVNVASDILARGREGGRYDKVAEELATARRRHPARHAEFVEDLAAHLAQPVRLRVLVVDGFSQLDETTRLVLKTYLSRHATHEHDELWVLLHSKLDKTLLDLRRGAVPKTPLARLDLCDLVPLSAAKRVELARRSGHPERAGLRRVKAIVRDDGQFVDLEALFADVKAEQDRRERPEIAGPLQLLYVFAVTAACRSNSWLNEGEVLSRLSAQAKLRSEVLRLLLPGRALTLSALRSQLEDLRVRFLLTPTPAAEERPGGARREFRATAEAGQVLQADPRRYGLCGPGLVHLFWTLYWADTKLDDRQPDVLWTAKVAGHLRLSADPAALDDKWPGHGLDVRTLSTTMFRIAVRTLRACLHTCQFGELRQLLQRAVALAVSDDAEEYERRLAELRPLGWQAFGILGERVLDVLLDLQPVALEPTGGTPALDQLFVQSLPDAADHSEDYVQLLTPSGDRHGVGAARCRAGGGWLAATAAPFRALPGGLLARAVAEARTELPAQLCTLASAARDPEAGEWRTTGFMALSVGLWAVALAAVPGRDGAGGTDGAVPPEQLETLFGTCFEAASDLLARRRSTDESRRALDLVLDCVAEELMTVVVAAGLLQAGRAGPGAAEGWEAVRGAVADAGETLGVRGWHAAADDDDERLSILLSETLRRMAVVQFTLHALELHPLAAAMRVRRGQLAAVVAGRTDGEKLLRQVLETLGDQLESTDTAGVLACLTAAEASRVSTHMAAQLAVHAAETAVAGRSGPDLSAELCLAAVKEAHSFGIDVTEPLHALLRERPARGLPDPPLATLLDQLPDIDLPEVALALLNSVGAPAASMARDQVWELLTRRADRVEDSGLSAVLDLEFHIHELKRRPEHHVVDVEDELERGIGWRELASYPYFLHLLMPTAPAPVADRLLEEALDVLDQRKPYEARSGYVYLAADAVRRTRRDRGGGPDGRLARAVRALRSALDYWQPRLPADTNVEMFDLLARVDREHLASHLERQQFWRRISLQVAEQDRLPKLLRDGAFFLLFFYYFRIFVFFGLQLEPALRDEDIDGDGPRRLMQAWHRDRVVPAPFTRIGSRSVLSGDFLALGYALFHAAAAGPDAAVLGEDELDSARAQVNGAAEREIEVLYEVLRSVPDLPQALVRILARHQQLVQAGLATAD